VGITTTESDGSPRCGLCWKRPRGGVMVRDVSTGKDIGICCAKPVDAELIASMIGDAEQEEDAPVLIAHDPFGRVKGTTSEAAQVLHRLRGSNFRQADADALRWAEGRPEPRISARPPDGIAYPKPCTASDGRGRLQRQGG
jgi:hypothetical protein